MFLCSMPVIWKTGRGFMESVLMNGSTEQEELTEEKKAAKMTRQVRLKEIQDSRAQQQGQPSVSEFKVLLPGIIDAMLLLVA